MPEIIENIIKNLKTEWDSLDRKKKKLFSVAAICLFAFLVYKTLGSEVKTLFALRGEYKELSHKLQIYEADIAEIPKIQHQCTVYQSRLDSLSVAFSNKTDLSALLPPKDVRVKLLKFEPAGLERLQGFSRVELNLKCAGRYANVVDYIHHLERTKLVTTIETLVFSASYFDPAETFAEAELSVYLGPNVDSTLVFSDFLNKNVKRRKDQEDSLKIHNQFPISFTGKSHYRAVTYRSKRHNSSRTPNLSVSGIWLGKVPKLVVNGKILKKGDKIYGWQLTSIDVQNSRAIFEKNSLRKEVRIPR